MKAHVSGFPRIGARRELKTALEAYWHGRLDLAGLEAAGHELRARHWQLQAAAGLDFVAVGDFSFYDHVLDQSARLGVVPERFGRAPAEIGLDLRFRMARGRAPCGHDAIACEMTKWFDTNYHYLVPELRPDQEFRLACTRLFDEVRAAQQLGHRPKPVLVGPLTWLWLAKTPGTAFDRLTLLDRLLPVYGQLLDGLAALGVEWVQLDEPVLTLDLPRTWQSAFERAYHRLQRRDINILLATYFGPLGDNLWTVSQLPVAGLHLDVTRSGSEWQHVLDRHAPYKILSLGVVDSRNVWRNDLAASAALLRTAHERLGDRLWVSTSASLLHVPVDLDSEDGATLAPEARFVLAFARQKLGEVRILRDAVGNPDSPGVQAALATAGRAADTRRRAFTTPDVAVRARIAALTPDDAQRRSAYPVRALAQQQRLQLPLLPTTTIGSFPQTAEIRHARAEHRAGRLDAAGYERAMQQEIAAAIRWQEEAGLDLLVHGEAERNDMVEYFGARLAGVLVTANGWVQSYGSRCVKPPVIAGDVARRAPMTVDWARYAQSLTPKPVKGMLTGPVTLLCWSFVRDDLPREQVALQLALAVRDEVRDLEAAGIAAIQVDEPAFREGLPLRQAAQGDYWRWAVRAFRVATAGVRDDTQIHTHMCYSEFNDCIEHIAALDADVITIETARSAMELLSAFAAFRYPNAIGPGVYDIHSPRVPEADAMQQLLDAAAAHIPPERLWVNPDCGLKTRGWPETKAALENMVRATKRLRATLTTA
ncbi:MAG: 5-methyltetrahydropteroyltriglutamate--homocysteine S-methyltransferase [Pseudomonadota bacterium]